MKTQHVNLFADMRTEGHPTTLIYNMWKVESNQNIKVSLFDKSVRGEFGAPRFDSIVKDKITLQSIEDAINELSERHNLTFLSGDIVRLYTALRIAGIS